MEKSRWTGIKRKSYAEYGIGKGWLKELQDGCKAGAYPPEVLAAACGGIGPASQWVLLSVREGVSFDALSVRWELGEIDRPPYCRTDLYAARRRFFADLDRVLRERDAGQ